MTLRLNGSNSGFSEITAPATAGDNTLTLPASNGSANQFLKNSGTAGTLNHSSMVEDSSGRLLVGTTTSETINGDNVNLQIKSTGASAGLSIHRSEANNAPPAINLALSRAGAVVSNNDPLGVINFFGHDGTDLNSSGGSINCLVDGSPGSNDMPGRLVFSTTADGASSPTERMRLDSNGNLYFGQSSTNTPGFGSTTNGIGLLPNGRFFSSVDGTFSQFNRNSSDGAVLSFARNSTGVGQISVGSSSTTYGTSSDYRLKENVVALDGAIARVKQLLPKRFNFIVDANTTVDGFLAHEAQTVVPEAITGTHNGVEVWKEDEKLPDGVSVGDNKLDEDGNTIPDYQGIDQSKLVPLLTAALQEAIGKIETLETQHADLLARVTALEAA